MMQILSPDAYMEGFKEACAEMGVEPEALVKTAQATPGVPGNYKPGIKRPGPPGSSPYTSITGRHLKTVGMGNQTSSVGMTPQQLAARRAMLQSRQQAAPQGSTAFEFGNELTRFAPGASIPYELERSREQTHARMAELEKKLGRRLTTAERIGVAGRKAVGFIPGMLGLKAPWEALTQSGKGIKQTARMLWDPEGYAAEEKARAEAEKAMQRSKAIQGDFDKIMKAERERRMSHQDKRRAWQMRLQEAAKGGDKELLEKVRKEDPGRFRSLEDLSRPEQKNVSDSFII